MSSQTQLMLLIRLMILMVASLTIGRADPDAVETLPIPQENQSATVVQRTDWRKVLRAEFNYTPTTPPNTAVQPEAVPETPANSDAVDPDVVVLPKYVVREATPDLRELEKDMRSTGKGANKVAKKLGIGPHEVKFRHFSVGYYTIFFIPVAGGMSW